MGTKRCHCYCGRSDHDDFTPLAHVLSYSGMVMRACGCGLGAKDRSHLTGIHVIVARIIVALDYICITRLPQGRCRKAAINLSNNEPSLNCHLPVPGTYRHRKVWFGQSDRPGRWTAHHETDSRMHQRWWHDSLLPYWYPVHQLSLRSKTNEPCKWGS